MFADQLSTQEKKAVIDLLIYVAWADGELQKEEIEYLNQFCERIDFKDKILLDNKYHLDINQICSFFQSLKAKKIAILELLNIAYSDNNYHESEKKGIEIIAEKLGVSNSDLNQAEKLIIEGNEWIKRGQYFINQ